MTLKGLRRLACGAALSLIAFIFEAGTTVTASVTTGCGDSSGCLSVRQTTFDALQLWEECDPTQPDPCILEPGNPKDCTGVLACPFAINAKYRTAAEEQELVMGEQSRGCYQCSIPSCFSGTSGYCEPISKRCLLIQSVTTEDGGTIVIGGGDSGGLSAIDNDSGGS